MAFDCVENIFYYCAGPKLLYDISQTKLDILEKMDCTSFVTR